MASYSEDFGLRMRALLERNGLNYNQAAKRTQFTASHVTIGMWSMGQVPADLEKFKRFLAFFEEDPEDWIEMIVRARLGVTKPPQTQLA